MGCVCNEGYYDSRHGTHIVTCVDSLFLDLADVAPWAISPADSPAKQNKTSSGF